LAPFEGATTLGDAADFLGFATFFAAPEDDVDADDLGEGFGASLADGAATSLMGEA
jgi:hypothetical protein